jgi:CHRD domain.
MITIHRQGTVWLLAACVITAVVGACGGGSDGGGTAIPPTATTKNVTLNGAQANPAVTTAATGSGFISVDDQTGAASGTVSTFGIANAPSAHLHEGAVGTNAGVTVELAQDSPGVWVVPAGTTLTAAQVASFKSGNLYVDVHTSANPNGEIRGQVGRMVFFATLGGSQEVPDTGSTATGTGRWVFDPETRTIAGTETVAGMDATVSHFHIAAPGTSAGVAIGFSGGPVTWTLAPTVLTDAQVTALLAGNFYANAHSVRNPGGEIRGQVYLPAKCTALTGVQEVPPNSSTATGTGCLSINPFTKGVAGRIETQGIAGTLAHAHTGAPGVVGPVVSR